MVWEIHPSAPTLYRHIGVLLSWAVEASLGSLEQGRDGLEGGQWPHGLDGVAGGPGLLWGVKLNVQSLHINRAESPGRVLTWCHIFSFGRGRAGTRHLERPGLPLLGQRLFLKEREDHWASWETGSFLPSLWVERRPWTVLKKLRNSNSNWLRILSFCSYV